MRIFRLAALLCISMVQLHAFIVETDKLADIREYIEKDTLVLFDIDNALAHPVGLIGSDEWFCHMIKEEQSQGKDFVQALNVVLPIYYEVQLQIPLQLIEQSAPRFLSDLQKEGYDIMALTARSLPLVNRTISQLSAIDIDFSHNHIGPVYAIRQAPYIYMYKRGILFSGDNNKGDALIDFLDFCQIVPSKVVFVDDKLKNLHAVEDAVEKRGIEFVGIRYSKLDDYVAAFDMHKAAKELDEFHHR